MKKSAEDLILIHVQLEPVMTSVNPESIQFCSKFNEKVSSISFLNLCTELRGRCVINKFLGPAVFGFIGGVDREDSLMAHLFRVKQIVASKMLPESPYPLSQDGLLNLLFHLMVGWHRRLEAWDVLKNLSVKEAIKRLKCDTQYFDHLTTRPIRDSDPREYIVKRSGWIFPGHFGAKFGG